MSDVIYLDAAASTPLAPEALDATMTALRHVGNPGAAHVAGFEAARLIDASREKLARLLNVGPASVIFTGSATEANNLALRGLERSGVRNGIVTTLAEHASVLATVGDLGRSGRPTATVRLRSTGEIDLDELQRAVSGSTAVVSIHAANNETGVIQPLADVVTIAHDAGALVHADASQLLAWGETSLVDGCDLITISSHKMYGPQGAAALIVRPEARCFLRPLMTGGGQERGLRSGTLNVAAIAGFGAAADLARRSGHEAAQATQVLCDRLLTGLEGAIGDVIVHGASAARRLPGILNVAVGASQPGSVGSEALLARLPRLAASTGSACHSGAPGPSPVLLAMGVSSWEAERSIRLSLSRYTTVTDIESAVTLLSDGYYELARLLGWGALEERYAR